MLGAQSLWARRDLYRATPTVTQDLGFSGLIRRTAPYSHLLRSARGCRRPILTWVLMIHIWIVCTKARNSLAHEDIHTDMVATIKRDAIYMLCKKVVAKSNHRPGRLSTVAISENGQSSSWYLYDWKASYRERYIASTVGILHDRLHSILTKDLAWEGFQPYRYQGLTVDQKHFVAW
jgi:hypothetical protein